MKLNLRIRNLLRLYIVVSLVGAAIFSLGANSILPLAFLTCCLYIWWRGFALLDLVVSYVSIFILPLFFEPILGTYLPVLFSLPLLAYVDIILRMGTARSYLPDSGVMRRPTNLGVTLLTALGAAGLLAVLLGDWTLRLAVIASLLYLTVVGVLIVWSIPRKPLQESKTFLRVLAGNQTKGDIEILNMTKRGGYVYLHSPCTWVKITPSVLPLAGPKVCTTLSMVPPLAGPAIPEVNAMVVDPWGLSQIKHRLQPIQLNVIPRARYAAWVAKKYLETAKPGTVVSHTLSPQLGGVHAARRGGEYYGDRPYQAGDSLKVIGWKHSAKFGQLIIQEFTEPYTTSPLLVVNLAASDEEEVDKLAFSVITVALTLAKEGIPAGIAAYDESRVVLVTDVLSPTDLVRRALILTQSINLYHATTRYLQSANVSRLKLNRDRLTNTKLDSAQKLVQLLSLQYTALKSSAELSPVTVAVNSGLARGKQVAQLVIISSLNHDVEALMFLTSKASSRKLKTLFLNVGNNLKRHVINDFPYRFAAKDSFMVKSPNERE